MSLPPSNKGKLMKTGSVENKTIEQVLADRGIAPGTSVTWPSHVQKRFGVYAGIDHAWATANSKAIVHASNGRLLIRPSELTPAPHVSDAFKADYDATYHPETATE